MKLKSKKIALNAEVKNLDQITEKANELVETLRKAKTLIDELASLGIEIEIKD